MSDVVTVRDVAAGAIELRSPAPFTFDGCDEFNAGYQALLAEWRLLVDDAPPRPTFVVAGAGEVRARGVGVQGIVRHGETSPEAMREKGAHVIEPFLIDTVLRPAAGAAMHGVRGFPSRAPIAGLEYEMDLRGVARELSL